MPRYFLEVSYKGTNYSGFQSQHNANTIQAEIEKAFQILQKQEVIMTGSSRTDAGVHALQNFLHFDFVKQLHPQFNYKMNAILPGDIVIKKVYLVSNDAHCRFDAVSREYKYYIYQAKDPFLADKAFFFPYKLDMGKLVEAADVIKEYTDFTSFSKRNTQVKTFNCEIQESNWSINENVLVYNVKANRFLRGMVKAMTATMLKVARNKMTLDEFRNVIEAKNNTKAQFAVPSHGLFLCAVKFPFQLDGF
jgi:tRNA pseudouridine38-40 synthase